MKNPIWDMEDGDFLFKSGRNTAVDSEGNWMMRMSDHMAMDMQTGEIHMTIGWEDEDEDPDC